mgnify:FL=1
MMYWFTPVHVIFYLFSMIAIVASLVVITSRNTVHGVLALVVTFFGMAGIWMLLHAEFLSLILILVYVGAVMTLFLFVIMMLNIHIEHKRRRFVRYFPFGLLVLLLTMGLILIAIGPAYFGVSQMPPPATGNEHYNNTKDLGSLLYTTYAYPFEVAGVLLLASIIAAITLTYRGPIKRRVQNAKEQLSVRPEDRVRLIKMPPVMPRNTKGS